MPELEGLIDAVFCSSDYGVSKSGGIWKHVLSSIKVQPAEICHLGDNIEADLHGAQRFGIQATHLLHQRPDVRDILEQRPQVAVQLLPNLRHGAPAPSYFHAQFASLKETSETAFNIGYVSLGPILYAFADFVLDEIHQLSMSGKRVKAAFLMRDGFLPSQACAALQGAPVGSDINISRFTSIAASLYDKEQVLKVLENSLGPDSMPALLNQFLLPEELTRKITRLVQLLPARTGICPPYPPE